MLPCTHQVTAPNQIHPQRIPSQFRYLIHVGVHHPGLAQRLRFDL